jgi:hypothetical protein
MTRITLAALTFAMAMIGAAQAQEHDNRLLIVNGNSGHVVYDDGRNDLFCVTRRHFVGYNDYGHRVFRRTMRCR